MSDKSKEKRWHEYAIGTMKLVEKNTRLLANGTLKVAFNASIDDEKRHIEQAGETGPMTPHAGMASVLLSLSHLAHDGAESGDILCKIERLTAPDDEGKCKFALKIDDRKLAAHIAAKLRENGVNFVGSNLSSRTRSKPRE